MLTFAYKVGGWVVANAYISKNKKYIFSKKSIEIPSSSGHFYPHFMCIEFFLSIKPITLQNN